MTRERWLRWGLATALSGMLFLWMVSSGASALREFPLDDAWIHQVYARGLLRDGRPTYNDGVAEAGFSSLAWLLTQLPVAALARLTGGSPAIAAKVVSALFGVVAAAGLGEIAHELSGKRRTGLVAIVVAAGSSGFAFSAASAMEVTLTTACLAWGCVALLARDARAPLRAGLWFGVAVLARLEVVAFVAVAAFSAALREGSRRERIVDVARVLVPAAAFVAGWGALDLALVGDPLPNTFHVKAGVPRLADALGYLLRQVVLLPGPIAATLAAVLFALGVGMLWRGGDARGRRAIVVTGAAALTLLAVALTRTIGATVQFYGTRYFLPFTPLFAPIIALGLEAVRPSWAYGIALATLLSARVPSLIDARGSYAEHCADIAKLYTEPAKALSTLPPQLVIGVEGAGSTRYWGGHRVLDLLGLNDHRVAQRYRVPSLSACIPLLDAPDALLVPGDWLPALQRDYELAQLARWDVPRWAAVGGGRPQTTVLLAARARPERAAACRARLNGP